MLDRLGLALIPPLSMLQFSAYTHVPGSVSFQKIRSVPYWYGERGAFPLVISLTDNGLLVDDITFNDVMELYIAITSRLSPSLTINKVWHRLLLFPVVYEDVTCRRAHELVGEIVGVADDDDGDHSSFTSNACAKE
jgi:hypothetical protein